MLSLIMLLAAQDPGSLLATARARTAAESDCVVDPDSTDITVCGLRGADKFRVPFIVHDAGDPRYESVAAERERLLHRTTPLQDLGPFQVGGGLAGASVTVGADGVSAGGVRTPAP